MEVPTDSINAITKAVLPPDHTLSRLLMPHLYVQLSQDGPTTSWRITRRVYSGIDGIPTYQAYVFPREVQKTHSDYGDFLASSRFIEALTAYDRDPRATRYTPLHDIAASIQY